MFDIGANDGAFSHCVASLANVAAIHAFEPLPSAFSELVTASEQSPVPLTCHNVALGEFNGEGCMSVPDVSRGSSSLLHPNHVFDGEVGVGAVRQQTVNIVRLDDYVAQRSLPMPDVVKIDVQGFEDRVIRGGAATVSAAAFVIAEVNFEALYEQSALFDDVYSLMLTLGFRLTGMTNPACGYSSHPLQADAIFAKQ